MRNFRMFHSETPELFRYGHQVNHRLLLRSSLSTTSEWNKRFALFRSVLIKHQRTKSLILQQILPDSYLLSSFYVILRYAFYFIRTITFNLKQAFQVIFLGWNVFIFFLHYSSQDLSRVRFKALNIHTFKLRRSKCYSGM